MRQTLATSFAVALALPLLAQQQPPPQTQPPAQPRPPVFRAGAHYVRVDAYPTDKKGNIVEGLSREDFEIYEDGKLQSVENLEFVTFDRWTPEGERKDPRTQQDAYDLAADPNWRVFVIVIDPTAYGMEGQHYLRSPLHEFIDRNLGPRDLFGLLTTENEWTDLTLGQTTTAANAVLDSREWLFRDDMFDERYQFYFECGLSSMIGRKKLDDTYALFEGLVKLLGLIRQEKKSIVFVSNGLSTPGTASTSLMGGGGGPGIPGIPTAPVGPPGGGPRIRPPTGGGGGPVGPMGHGDRIATPSRQAKCDGERMRLAGIDFGQRYRDLLRDARAANVAFYPISPSGLQTIPFKPTGGADLAAFHHNMRRTDSLMSLASETDGIAIVNTNDLSGGLRRIANDMHAYYVLGYYTTNTKWDGGVRSIKVKLKPKRDTIRARKQYRAPTLEEIAALSTPSVPRVATEEEIALAALGPAAAGGKRRPEPPPDRFLGEVRTYLNGEPMSPLRGGRADRIRVEWPIIADAEETRARLLDRRGHPIPVAVELRQEVRVLYAELTLAPFARGEYIVEIIASASAVSERKLVAFRVE